MSNLLSSDDLALVRREWAHDLVDLHPEVGPSATVSAVAVAGGATLALTGLQTGTIARGTRLNVFTSGVGRRYAVTADVLIVAHAATVAIAPILEAAVGIGDTVEAVPDTSSVYNQIEGEQLFTDVQLEDYARRANIDWGDKIAAAENPKRRFFEAIELLTIQQKVVPGGPFWRALMADDPSRGGAAQIDALQKRAALILSFLQTRTTGPRYVEVYR